MSLASILAGAVQQVENVNPAYNNPGAISGTGDTGTSFGQGIGIYSTLDAGAAALNNQMEAIFNGSSQYYNPSMTLDEFGSVYKTGQPLSSTGDTSYGSALASVLGVPSSTQLSQLAGAAGSAFSSNTSTLGSLASGASSALTGNLSQIFSGHSLEDFITIIIGIVLVAAGVLAFRTSRTVIQVATKAVKAGGKTAAEAAAV